MRQEPQAERACAKGCGPSARYASGAELRSEVVLLNISHDDERRKQFCGNTRQKTRRKQRLFKRGTYRRRGEGRPPPL